MVRATVLFAGVIVALAATDAAYAASRIGVASAVSNSVTGTIAGKTKRMRAGDGVVQNEVVRTRARSTAQLLFRDQTALTVGPKSRVKLDRYVYNPSSRSGKIVLNSTRGAFRFVSGVAKSRTYRIRTPVAAIGVRGTIFDWFIDAQGNLVVVHVRGIVDVCPYRRRGCLTMTRPGQVVAVRRDGSTSGPRRATRRSWNVTNGVPFPLFSSDFGSDFAPPHQREVIDERGFGANPGGSVGGGTSPNTPIP